MKQPGYVKAYLGSFFCPAKLTVFKYRATFKMLFLRKEVHIVHPKTYITMQTNKFRIGNIQIFEKARKDNSVYRWMRCTLCDPTEPDVEFTKWIVREQGYISRFLEAATEDTTPEVARFTAKGIKVYRVDDMKALREVAKKQELAEDALLWMKNIFPITRPTNGIYARIYRTDTTDSEGNVHKAGEKVLRKGKEVLRTSITMYVKHVIGPDGELEPAEDVDEIMARILDDSYVKVGESSTITPGEASDAMGSAAEQTADDAIAAANAALLAAQQGGAVQQPTPGAAQA